MPFGLTASTRMTVGAAVSIATATLPASDEPVPVPGRVSVAILPAASAIDPLVPAPSAVVST